MGPVAIGRSFDGVLWGLVNNDIVVLCAVTVILRTADVGVCDEVDVWCLGSG